MVLLIGDAPGISNGVERTLISVENRPEHVGRPRNMNVLRDVLPEFLTGTFCIQIYRIAQKKYWESCLISMPQSWIWQSHGVQLGRFPRFSAQAEGLVVTPN